MDSIFGAVKFLRYVVIATLQITSNTISPLLTKVVVRAEEQKTTDGPLFLAPFVGVFLQ